MVAFFEIMKIPLRVEGEITEDGRLVVDLPPEVPRGRVMLTLEIVAEDDLELSDDDLQGLGLTPQEIASSPEMGAWAQDPEVPSGAEFVENLRRSSPRYAW